MYSKTDNWATEQKRQNEHQNFNVNIIPNIKYFKAWTVF